jgi:hypothetical protein
MLVEFSELVIRCLDGLRYLGSEIPPPPFIWCEGVTSSSVQEVMVKEEASATKRM